MVPFYKHTKDKFFSKERMSMDANTREYQSNECEKPIDLHALRGVLV
jgi:hypothetical protein